MDHNKRTYPSLRWVGMDDEQIFVRGMRDEKERRNLVFEVPKTWNLEPLPFWPGSLRRI